MKFKSLFSFFDNQFYFAFTGLFHCYSRAMNVYVHHTCVHTGVYYSRPTIKHLMISTTTIAVGRK